VGDREVRIVFSMRNPRVIVFGSLLSDDECDELIALSKPKLVRSETVITSTGGSEVNAARTSEGMFFERGENPLVRRIEERIAQLVNWPIENGEGLQILHYQPVPSTSRTTTTSTRSTPARPPSSSAAASAWARS
jgi:prolyl 4-hydroxylase